MKYSKIKILAVAVSLILSPAMLFAYVEETTETGNSVNINETVLSRCGDHMVAFSGVATYGPGSQELIISIDGITVLNTYDEPADWSLLTPVTTGPHVLTAQVRDSFSRNFVEDTFSFSVATCLETSGGGGDETDCCIGPDPESVAGQVKGVTIKATPAPAPVEELVELPSAGPNPLLPLMLVGSWFSVAVVGFKKKW